MGGECFTPFLPARDDFPPAGDKKRTTFRFLYPGPCLRKRWRSRQREEDGDYEPSFKEAKGDPAHPIYSPEQHHFHHHCHQMTDEGEQEGNQNKNDDEGKDRSHRLRKLNEGFEKLRAQMTVAKRAPPAGNEPEKRANLPYQTVHEPLGAKGEQNSSGEDIDNGHGITHHPT